MLLACLVPSMALLVPPFAALAQNLIPHGDCEVDADGDGFADDWQFSGDRGVTATGSLDVGYESPRSQRLECTAYEHLSPASHAMLCQLNTIQLREGQWYELSLAAKGERITAGAVSVSLVDTAVWEGLGLQQGFRPRREWRTYSFPFRATKTINEGVRLQFWYLSTGTLWLDNVSLVEREPIRTRFTEVVPDAGGRNLVPNSSFELGGIAWGSIASIPGWGGNLNRLVGEVDTTTAARHGSSLKIELRPDNLPVCYFDYFEMLRQPVRAPLAANRGWMNVQPGKPYTLSTYLKADPPGLTAILQLRDSPWSEQHTTVKAGADWQRHSFTCTPGNDQAFVCVGPDLEASGLEAGTLWVDAVQLEAGETATDYEPRAVVEVGLRLAGGRPIVAVGEPAAMETVAFNAGDQPRPWTCTTVGSGFGTDAYRVPAALVAEPGQTITQEEILATGPAFLRTGIEAQGAAVVTNRPTRLAIIERYEDADSAFGMNHAYPWPELVDYSRMMGLSWFRDWSLKWQHVEPEPVRFDFTEADYQINRVLEGGSPVLGLLPFPSSNWGSSAPLEAGVGEGYPGSRARMAYMPADLNQFADYVRRTVEHYRGRISVWEVLNEPVYTDYALPQRAGYTPADYVKLLRVAYDTIKAVDPQLTVLGGIAGPPDLYTREFIEAGGLECIDGLTIHIYPGQAPPEGYVQGFEQLLRRMEEAGRPRPLWFTEGAYYADDDPPMEPFDAWLTPVESEWEAAILQARFDIILLAHNTRRIIRHSGTCATINNEDVASIFFEYDAEPRKMVLPQAALAHLFGPDTEALGRLETPEGVYAYAFRSRGRTLMAAWALDGEHTLRQVPGFTPLLDVVGNTRNSRTLTEEPLFIIGPDGATAGDFQMLLRED